MDCEKNYYELLGVQRDASVEEIKEAYKEIARVYHPDSQFYSEVTDMRPDGSHIDIFKELTAAYHTLTNATRRAAYDQTLAPELPDWEDPVDEDAEILEALERLGVEPENVGMQPKKPRRERKNSAAFGIFGNVATADSDMAQMAATPGQFNKTAFGHGEHGLVKKKRATLTNLVRPRLDDDDAYEPAGPPSGMRPAVKGGAGDATKKEVDHVQKLLLAFAAVGSFCFVASLLMFLMLK